MTRARNILIIIVALGLLILGGCEPKVDETLIEQEISAKIYSFREAVQAYDVEGMLAFLDQDNFSLTITEDGQSYQGLKDLATLRNELAEDEEKQLRWREEQGYILTMVLGNISLSNVSKAGAIALVPFEIFEETEGISQALTDEGTMVVTMVKMEGDWLCQEMVNDFKSQGSIVLSIRRITGFGLGGSILK